MILVDMQINLNPAYTTGFSRSGSVMLARQKENSAGAAPMPLA